ncbi:MAG: hypothetical protein ACPGR8_06255 [Limisphaerales bacterium]
MDKSEKIEQLIQVLTNNPSDAMVDGLLEQARLTEVEVLNANVTNTRSALTTSLNSLAAKLRDWYGMHVFLENKNPCGKSYIVVYEYGDDAHRAVMRSPEREKSAIRICKHAVLFK